MAWQIMKSCYLKKSSSELIIQNVKKNDFYISEAMRHKTLVWWLTAWWQIPDDGYLELIFWCVERMYLSVRPSICLWLTFIKDVWQKDPRIFDNTYHLLPFFFYGFPRSCRYQSTYTIWYYDIQLFLFTRTKFMRKSGSEMANI